MLLFLFLFYIHSIYAEELPEDGVVWILSNHRRDGFYTTVNYCLFKTHPVGILNEYNNKGYIIVGHSITKDKHYSWTLHKPKPKHKPK